MFKNNEKNSWPLPLQETKFEKIGIISLLSNNGNILSVDNRIIDLETMQIIDELRDGPNILYVIGMTYNADFIFATLCFNMPIVVLERKEKGYKKISIIEEESIESIKMLRVSPDSKLLLINSEEKLYLYDLENKTITQKINPDFSIKMINFDADGTSISYSRRYDTYILNKDGTKNRLKNVDGISFSPDGKYAALLKMGLLEIVKTENLYNSKKAISIKLEGSPQWHAGIFSPDSKYFGFFDDSKGNLLIIDVLSGKIATRISNPVIPENKFSLGFSMISTYLLGFNFDSTLIFCLAESKSNKYLKDDETEAIFIWRVSDGIFLGTITRYYTGQFDRYGKQIKNLLGICETGFFAPFKKYNIEKKISWQKKLFLSKTGKKMTASPWYKPEVTFKALKGVSIKNLLNDNEIAQLSDIRKRWNFFENCLINKIISDDVKILDLVIASHGLTYFLDLIIDYTKKLNIKNTTFGVQKKNAILTGDMILNAINELKKYTFDELNARIKE